MAASAQRAMSDRHFVLAGVANEWSLAWSVALRLAEQGATCHIGCLASNERRVARLVRELGDSRMHIGTLDVRSDDSVREFMAGVRGRTDCVHGLLHAIAYAPADDLEAGVLGTSREGFALSLDVSVFSLIALSAAIRPLLREGSSIVALTYHGAQKCLPGYDLMGVAKAALESLVRYAANELGPSGVRVNAVSAGPVMTLAASAFPDLEQKIERAASASPLRRRITQDDVAAMVEYLFSSASSAVTGQCLYVDAGLNSMGATG